MFDFSGMNLPVCEESSGRAVVSRGVVEASRVACAPRDRKACFRRLFAPRSSGIARRRRVSRDARVSKMTSVFRLERFFFSSRNETRRDATTPTPTLSGVTLQCEMREARLPRGRERNAARALYFFGSMSTLGGRDAFSTTPLVPKRLRKTARTSFISTPCLLSITMEW